MIAFRWAISASICLASPLAPAIFAGPALAQSAVTAPSSAAPPPMQVVPDSRFDPVASVNVSGPSGGMQVMRERGRRSEPVVVVTPNRSAPVAGAPVEHRRSATRPVVVAGSSVSPLHYQPDPVSEPKVTITPSTH